MKNCKRCGLVKDWSGDNPNCPFQTTELFGKNWNCGIINQIREICDEASNGTDYRLHYSYCDDQKYAVIQTDCIEDEEGNYLGLCLWVSWYKNRGATDEMWILSHCEPPRKPSYSDLERIVNHYKLNPLL